MKKDALGLNKENINNKDNNLELKYTLRYMHHAAVYIYTFL